FRRVLFRSPSTTEQIARRGSDCTRGNNTLNEVTPRDRAFLFCATLDDWFFHSHLLHTVLPSFTKCYIATNTGSNQISTSVRTVKPLTTLDSAVETTTNNCRRSACVPFIG